MPFFPDQLNGNYERFPLSIQWQLELSCPKGESVSFSPLELDVCTELSPVSWLALCLAYGTGLGIAEIIAAILDFDDLNAPFLETVLYTDWRILIGAANIENAHTSIGALNRVVTGRYYFMNSGGVSHYDSVAFGSVCLNAQLVYPRKSVMILPDPREGFLLEARQADYSCIVSGSTSLWIGRNISISASNPNVGDILPISGNFQSAIANFNGSTCNLVDATGTMTDIDCYGQTSQLYGIMTALAEFIRRF